MRAEIRRRPADIVGVGGGEFLGGDVVGGGPGAEFAIVRLARAEAGGGAHGGVAGEREPFPDPDRALAFLCIDEIDLGGRLLSMNRAGLKMMGVQEEGAIGGLRDLSAVADEDKERIGRLRRLASEGQAMRCTVSVAMRRRSTVTRRGAFRWSWSGWPGGGLARGGGVVGGTAGGGARTLTERNYPAQFGSPIKVLAIEDQPVAARQLMAVLRSLGHKA